MHASPCSFYDRDAPIYTMSRFLPPSKIMDAEVTRSIIGDGCVVKGGSKISGSVLGVRSLVGSDCIIEDSMLMGAGAAHAGHGGGGSGSAAHVGIKNNCLRAPWHLFPWPAMSVQSYIGVR